MVKNYNTDYKKIYHDGYCLIAKKYLLQKVIFILGINPGNVK